MYVHALAGGGAERVWAILATEFCKFGHEVVVAVDYEARENMAYLSPDARLVVLGGGHLRSTARLAGLIRRERPDVTISALASSNLKHTVAAVLAGRLRRSVITYHGYTANERGLLSRIGYLATPLLTRMAARTIAVSDGLARYLQERLAANPSRLSRIYNPVLSDRVAEKAPNRTVPVILSVGRLDHAKDHQTLLRAFAKVRQPSARLVILGEGVEHASLAAEIDRLGLSDRVELRGYVMKPWSAFAEASCLVLSSRVEAFGLAVVEALAHGMPVVATDCDGPREILLDPALGVIVPVGDAAKMAEAIEVVLEDPGDADRRRRRAADFSPRRAATAYVALFEAILEQDSRVRRSLSGRHGT